MSTLCPVDPDNLGQRRDPAVDAVDGGSSPSERQRLLPRHWPSGTFIEGHRGLDGQASGAHRVPRLLA